jgi:hypothetical protein
MAVGDPLLPVESRNLQRRVSEWSGHPRRLLGDSGSVRIQPVEAIHAGHRRGALINGGFHSTTLTRAVIWAGRYSPHAEVRPP